MSWGFKRKETAQAASALVRQMPPSQYVPPAQQFRERHWIAKAPVGGVPAFDSTGNTAGTADCDVFLLQDDGTLSADLLDVDQSQFQLKIYNLGDAIAEDTFFQVNQQGDKAIAINPGGAGKLNCDEVCKCLCECDGFDKPASCQDLPCGKDDTEKRIGLRLTISGFEDCTHSGGTECDGQQVDYSWLNRTMEWFPPEDWDGSSVNIPNWQGEDIQTDTSTCGGWVQCYRRLGFRWEVILSCVADPADPSNPDRNRLGLTSGFMGVNLVYHYQGSWPAMNSLPEDYDGPTEALNYCCDGQPTPPWRQGNYKVEYITA